MRRLAPLLLLVLSVPVRATPSAFERLDGLALRYADLDRLESAGVIETEVGRIHRRIPFRLAVEGGIAAFTVGSGEAETLFWRDRTGLFVARPSLGQYRQVDSPVLELDRVLGPDLGQALVVTRLLLEGDGGFRRAEAATVDEQRACGDSICDVVTGTFGETGLRLELGIDQASGLVRTVVAVVPSEASTIDQAVASAGLATADDSGEPSRMVVVRHEEVDTGPTVSLWSRPAGLRLVSAWEDPPSAPFELPEFVGEPVSVDLFTLPLRIVDRGGQAIPDLSPDALELEIADRPIEIVSLDWEPAGVDPLADVPAEELAAAGIQAPAPGRLFVFFYQVDFHPSKVIGQMRMQNEAERLLDTLTDLDQAAIVSFHSHLDLHQDFTHDRERLRDAMRKAWLRTEADEPYPGRPPSLARHLSAVEMADAATPERGLELVAEALRPFPQPKVIVWLGWGLGRFGSTGVRLGADYRRAREALEAANATVFALDVTDADYHSLEIGLKQVAADTGGTYAKTNVSPTVAAQRLAGTLEGRYVLTYSLPRDLPAGSHRMRLRLVDVRGEILASPTRIEIPERRP